MSYPVRLLNAVLVAGAALSPSFEGAVAQTPTKTSELSAACINRDGAIAAHQRILSCSDALASPRLAGADRAQILAARGEAYRAARDETQAAADLQQAVLLYNSLIDQKADASLFLQRGSTLHALGNRDLALSDYDQVIQLDPRNARALIERGALLVKFKGDYARAIADLDKALAVHPDNVDALMLRGEAHGDAGDFARGLSDLDQAIKLAPQRSTAYLLRGIVNGRRGDLAAALGDYNKALSLDPSNAEALVNRAAILSTNGDQDGAIADLDTAIALQSNDPVAYYNRGYARFAKRQYEQAIADYGNALRLDPNMGMAYNNRCMTRVLAGRELAEATADCDAALKAMPGNLLVRNTRGFVYLKLGKPDLALAEYDAALKIDANRALSLFGRGLARGKLGKAVEGEADKAAARALDPAIDRQFSAYGLN